MVKKTSDVIYISSILPFPQPTLASNKEEVAYHSLNSGLKPNEWILL